MMKTGRGNFRRVLLENELAIEQNAKIPICAGRWPNGRGINSNTRSIACDRVPTQAKSVLSVFMRNTRAERGALTLLTQSERPGRADPTSLTIWQLLVVSKHVMINAMCYHGMDNFFRVGNEFRGAEH